METAGRENNILVLLCEDSAEGVFTGVYEAYALRRPHASIRLRAGAAEQFSLFTEYREVRPDREKADKVIRTLKSRFCEEDYEALWLALTAPVPEKAQAVYGSVVWGLSGSGGTGSILRHLTDPDVYSLMTLSRNASGELHHLKGFTRFSELRNGLLLAVVEPRNAILPMLAAHFADRLPGESFLLYDKGRKQYAAHPAGQDWFLVKEEGEEKRFLFSEEESYYSELFRQFCHSISIEERKNMVLQRNMLPLRFRTHMTEFTKSNEK